MTHWWMTLLPVVSSTTAVHTSQDALGFERTTSATFDCITNLCSPPPSYTAWPDL